jgi:hypothetical protein
LICSHSLTFVLHILTTLCGKHRYLRVTIRFFFGCWHPNSQGVAQEHSIHNNEDVRWLASTISKMSDGWHLHFRRCPMAGIHILEDVRWLPFTISKMSDGGHHSLEVCYDNRPTSLAVFRSVAKIVEKINMCTFLSKYLNVISLFCLGDQEQYSKQLTSS